ncbi:hypothetical protein [Luteimonas aquatica]|uniref:hypothetical protein n=1 Tax=Luteimonas aquatica TaxID=450364 RepID=UPI001F562241|nr:hypothetical protein [Luteimonas aquatica]
MRISTLLLASALIVAAHCADAAERARPVRDAAVSCRDCGTVVRIESQRRRGKAVLRAVGGALGDVALGHIDSDVATVAGAARDAATDDGDDEREDTRGYDIAVRMDDGRYLTLRQEDPPEALRKGARVRVHGRRLSLLP